MPFYDYHCAHCGSFAVQRRIAERDVPTACPTCRQIAVRLLTAPNLALMGAGERQIHQRNEKSAHEPTVHTRHRCGSGCGCGAPSANPAPAAAAKRSVEVPKLGKFQRGRRRSRPWMLGH